MPNSIVSIDLFQGRREEIKKYPALLDITGLNEKQRTVSLRGVFNQDIQNNPALLFRGKQIRPIKAEGEASMGSLFNHLTREETKEKQPNGSFLTKRVFEKEKNKCVRNWQMFYQKCIKPQGSVIFLDYRASKLLLPMIWQDEHRKNKTFFCYLQKMHEIVLPRAI